MTFKREIVAHATEAEWLEARKGFITSTEAAALFGAGAYVKTPYELWAIKAGVVPSNEVEDSDRLRWGRRLEGVIAAGIAEDLGLIAEPYKVFITMPEFRMGSSFDWIVTGIAADFDGDNEARRMFREHGAGLLEIKNLDSLQFKRAWDVDGEHVEAPVQIEAQVQWQMEVADKPWSILCPLIGGNTTKPIIRVRDHAFGAAAREKSADLWRRVHAMAPPQPDFTKDAATIAKVYQDNDGSSIDLSDNPRVLALAKAYKKAGAEEKAAKEAKDAAKAELLTIIEHAKSVAAGPFKISAGTNNPTVRKAYFRDGYQRVTITLTDVPASEVEASEVPAFRNFRLSGGEAA